LAARARTHLLGLITMPNGALRSGFFHQMKVRQPIGRQDSMQTVIRTSGRLDSFLHKAAQNFELLSNIQDQKLKIKNI
jgi:hypothetical protein